MPFAEHPLCVEPDDDNPVIWRYMDFAQLVHVLENRELFFPRADKFEDPFEGTLPRKHRKIRKNEVPENWADELLPRFRRICKKYTFLSCWHINNSESAAMWDLYLEADHGVCIQSTYERFLESFKVHDEDDIHISKVNYIDFEEDTFKGWEEGQLLGSSISPFIHKRENFDYEQEIRAIIHSPSWRDPEGDSFITAETIEKTPLDEDSLPGKGKSVSVDVDTLIESIHVSPEAGDWVGNLLKDLAPYFKIYDNKIDDSSMGKNPKY